MVKIKVFRVYGFGCYECEIDHYIEPNDDEWVSVSKEELEEIVKEVQHINNNARYEEKRFVIITYADKDNNKQADSLLDTIRKSMAKRAEDAKKKKAASLKRAATKAAKAAKNKEKKEKADLAKLIAKHGLPK